MLRTVAAITLSLGLVSGSGANAGPFMDGANGNCLACDLLSRLAPIHTAKNTEKCAADQPVEGQALNSSGELAGKAAID
ncbi:MAG: hypothetical protein N2444_03920 [Methylocystis sp.]|nr:hypothetical protein [Methylocystis sp.]